MPRFGVFFHSPPLGFDLHDRNACTKQTPDVLPKTVLEHSKILYNQRPQYRPLVPAMNGKRKHYWTFAHRQKDHCIDIIARALLDATVQFEAVVPVRLEHSLVELSLDAVCHYGLVVTFARSRHYTILPICPWIRDYAEHSAHRSWNSKK